MQTGSMSGREALINDNEISMSHSLISFHFLDCNGLHLKFTKYLNKKKATPKDCSNY